MTAVLATPPFLAFFDLNGNPLSGGLIYTYAAGTTTPKATYTDESGTIPMPNPIGLDSAGRATWWIAGAYKYIIKDALGNTIATTDNVTSFTTLAAAGAAFFQSFSGDGSTTAFVLSTDEGTDSKGLMVFVNSGLVSDIANGTFATDTIWVKGAGWTIGAGVATATGAISTAISQTATQTIVQGQAYSVTYTITASAGSLTPSIGGQAGTPRTAAGTYMETIVAGSTQAVAFTGAGFTGTLGNVTVNLASSSGYQILNPNTYTINGTALAFATAPATGTNNIFVFAPSSLLGAASSAAALAQQYATQALTSETNAATSAASAAASATIASNSVASVSDTSVTSNTIGTGLKTFTVSSGKNFTAGQIISIINGGSNILFGQVTSYSGTTLSALITQTTGSGTYTSWNLYATGGFQFGPYYNVKAYGALGDGTTNDTTAIAAAISAASGGGVVLFPPGTYKYTSLTVGSAITLQGAGWSASTLSCSAATGTCITLGISSGLKDMQLTSSVTRTANPYIDIQSNAVLLERLSIVSYFQGVQIGTVGGAQPVDVQILDCNFNTPVVAASSYGIFAQFTSNLVMSGITMSGPTSGTQPDYGIRLLAGDTCFMSNTNITKHGTTTINPAVGSSCLAVTAVNCSFDNAGITSGGSVPSFNINPAGSVKDCKFTNCWFGYSAASFGMAMQPTSTTGLVDGMQFTGCEFVNNGDGGIIWGNNGSGALVKNIVITGSASAGNTNTGMRFYGGASGVTITGNRVGPYAARGANGYGIVIDGGSASADVLITGNNVIGNTTANISDSASGSNVQVYNNNGYNGSTNLSAVTPGASPWTYTAGHTPEVHYLRVGTVSNISQDGTQIFAATPATVNLAPNESYVVTYSGTPTVNKKLL